MEQFVVSGGARLTGVVEVAGAKNSVLKLMAASLLADPDEPPGATNPLVATYLNRLSDLLFVLARVANPDGDVRWVPGASR